MDRWATVFWEYAPSLYHGVLTTALLSAAVVITATPLALGVALMRATRLGWIFAIYVNLIKMIPALIVLYVTFYLGPRVGVRLSPYNAAYLGLTCVAIAYLSEDIRGGLKAVPNGQYAAAAALALPFRRVLWRITLPQAIPAIIPNYITSLMLIIQGTSLASLVAVNELAAATGRAISITQEAYLFLAFSCLVYLAINAALSLVKSFIERHFRARYQ